MKAMYELLPHTADIKMRIYASDYQQLFKNALISMFSYMRPKSHACLMQQDETYSCTQLPSERSVELQSPDAALLLIDFLAYALALSEIYHEAYFDVVITECTQTYIKGKMRGVPVEGFEGVAIKAVTYNELVLTGNDAQWQAEIVFDI